MQRVSVEFRPLLRKIEINKHGWENNVTTRIDLASLQRVEKNDYSTLHLIVFVVSVFIIFGLILGLIFTHRNKYFIHADDCRKNAPEEAGCF